MPVTDPEDEGHIQNGNALEEDDEEEQQPRSPSPMGMEMEEENSPPFDPQDEDEDLGNEDLEDDQFVIEEDNQMETESQNQNGDIDDSADEKDYDSDEGQEEEEEEGVDYTCEICEVAFNCLTELFKHLEQHDADQYAFAEKESEASNLTFGDVEDPPPQPRKWPSRFLKFPSQVFHTLSTFPSSNGNGVGSNDLRFFKTHVDSASGRGEDEEIIIPQHRLDIYRRLVKFPVRKFGMRENLLCKNLLFMRRRYKCPYCTKEFQRSDHFRQHISNHAGSKPFICKLCGKRFSVIITLRRHMSTHAAFKPYKCSKCPRRFNQSGHLKRHEESPFTHTEHYLKMDYRRRCRLCFQLFPNDNTRLAHERVAHGTERPTTILRCRYLTCRLIQPSMKDLVEHYKKSHPTERLRDAEDDLPSDSVEGNEENDMGSSPHIESPSTASEECRMCFQYFLSITERNYHEQSVHDINNPLTVLVCKYTDCQKILGAKNWLARHIREHRKKINEESGEKTLEKKDPDGGQKTDTVPSEGEWQEESWECRVCDEYFPGQRERTAHERFYHETANPAVNFNCKVCSAHVGRFGALLFHLQLHHQNESKPPPPPPPQPPVTTPPSQKLSQPNLIFLCRHCDIQFTDQHLRLNHEYDEHNTRDALNNYFTCKVCGKTMTLRGLRKHLRRIHGQTPQPDETPATDDKETDDEVSPSDGESTSPQPEATTPQQRESPKQSIPKLSPQKLTPPTTNVVYKRANEPTNTSWVCRLCFERFDEQRQRETHEHTVHGTNSPNATYVCKYSECEDEFDTFRALIKHLRQHGETTVPTGQQKLPIPSLTQYKPNTPTGSGLAVLQNDPKDSFLWRCRLCWEVFPSQQHRLSHEQHSHQTNDPNKPRQCKYCPKSFSTIKQLVRHLETHGEGRHSIDGDSLPPNESEDSKDDSGPPTLEPQVEVLSPKKNTRVICRICHEEFPHIKARIFHEAKVHHTKNMRQEQVCKVCTTTLPNFRQLLVHFQTQHRIGHGSKGDS